MLHCFLRSSDWSFRNSMMCLNLLHHLADIRDSDSRRRFTGEAVSPLSSLCNIKQMKCIFGKTASLYSSSCLKCDSHSHRSSLKLCVGDEGVEETMIVNISLWSRIQTDNDGQFRSLNGEVVGFFFFFLLRHWQTRPGNFSCKVVICLGKACWACTAVFHWHPGRRPAQQQSEVNCRALEKFFFSFGILAQMFCSQSAGFQRAASRSPLRPLTLSTTQKVFTESFFHEGQNTLIPFPVAWILPLCSHLLIKQTVAISTFVCGFFFFKLLNFQAQKERTK